LNSPVGNTPTGLQRHSHQRKQDQDRNSPETQASCAALHRPSPEPLTRLARSRPWRPAAAPSALSVFSVVDPVRYGRCRAAVNLLRAVRVTNHGVNARGDRIMSRYDPLRWYLARLPADRREVRLTFQDVEKVIGSLPDSARSYRPWWGVCCVVGSTGVANVEYWPVSDQLGEFDERSHDPLCRRDLDAEFVVTAPQVLHEGMPGDDYLRCPLGL
jgi:hypothetical protein